MLTIFNTLSRNHTCTLEENLTPIMCVLSIHGKLHLYKYANHLSSKVQNFPPTITTQRDTHFHQQAITQPARNPLHHQTWISSIAPMNNKPSKAYNLPVNKNNQMQKKQKNLDFRRPQPFMMPNHHVVCYLLPFIHSILEFSHSSHPQKDS